jgi:hypothetical protein
MYPGPLPLHPTLPDVLGLTARAVGPRRPSRRRSPVPGTDAQTLPRATPPRGVVA